MDGMQLCYLLIIIVSIGFLVYGFMDLLKKRQHGEDSEAAVISRQIRGFAFIMLAQVIMVVGTLICFGMDGGLKGLGSRYHQMTRHLT